MKRIIFGFMMGFLLLSISAFGAGSVNCQPQDNINSEGYYEMVCTATADGSGTFPATSLLPWWPGFKGYYIYELETAPGSVAPSDGYSITLADGFGSGTAADLLAGKGVSQSNAKASIITGINTFADSPPTLNITGNSVASAVITVKIVLVR